MAIRSIIEVDVADESFQTFRQSFERYQQAVKDLLGSSDDAVPDLLRHWMVGGDIDTQREAIAKLRLDLAGAVSSARQAGIDSREIANILEQHVDIWRQNDAMMRPVL